LPHDPDRGPRLPLAPDRRQQGFGHRAHSRVRDKDS
jgi:hypothetical protein